MKSLKSFSTFQKFFKFFKFFKFPPQNPKEISRFFLRRFFLNFKFQFQVSSFRIQVSCFKFQASSFRFQVPGSSRREVPPPGAGEAYVSPPGGSTAGGWGSLCFGFCLTADHVLTAQFKPTLTAQMAPVKHFLGFLPN